MNQNTILESVPDGMNVVEWSKVNSSGGHVVVFFAGKYGIFITRYKVEVSANSSWWLHGSQP